MLLDARIEIIFSYDVTLITVVQIQKYIFVVFNLPLIIANHTHWLPVNVSEKHIDPHQIPHTVGCNLREQI